MVKLSSFGFVIRKLITMDLQSIIHSILLMFSNFLVCSYAFLWIQPVSGSKNR